MPVRAGGSKLQILLGDDEQIIHRTLGDYLRDAGHKVTSVNDGLAVLELARAETFDLVLVDVRMPQLDGLEVTRLLQSEQPELAVVVITGHGTLELAIEALRIGAADFLAKPIGLLELDGVLERVVRLSQLQRRSRKLTETVRGLQRAAISGDQLIGESPAIERVRALVQQVVEARCETVLITGETGTGKEVVAQSIHALGGKDRPFIAVNCAALPENLVESELFGHVRGAFTGAVGDRPGCFEMADGGTLFLDEISDLSAAAQATLLRVLETRRVRRLGAVRETEFAACVLAATHTPLERLVAEGHFRADLFYRLGLFPIHLPPLREHLEDVLPLAEHFLELFAGRRRVPVPVLAPDAQAALCMYSFPGNARELRNVVERAAMVTRDGEIRAEHLSFPTAGAPVVAGPQESGEKERLRVALEAVHWNRRKAAEALQMPYSTLRWKMNRLGLG